MVQFQNVVPGPVYVITLYIQNISQAPQRIQFKGLATRAFNLRDLPPGSVAPGLDTVVEIEFQVPESRGASQGEFHDKLVVSSATETIEIPLRAYAPAPKLEFDGFLNLGTIVLGDSVAKHLDIVNIGQVEGRVSIKYQNDADITISPTQFTLAGVTELEGVTGPGHDKSSDNTQRVKIEARGNNLGSMRLLAAVQIDGQDSTRMIDINATVVEQRLEMMMPDRPGISVTELPFGTLHYGERRTMSIVMVNNGPREQPFIF